MPNYDLERSRLRRVEKMTNFPPGVPQKTLRPDWAEVPRNRRDSRRPADRVTTCNRTLKSYGVRVDSVPKRYASLRHVHFQTIGRGAEDADTNAHVVLAAVRLDSVDGQPGHASSL